MPTRTYTPPATHFARTRCTIARILIPLVWGLGLLTLKILPPLHPYRIYGSDRIRHSREIGRRATAISGEGRLLPFQLPYLTAAYLVLDALSPMTKGPFDLLHGWHLDERVLILRRLADLAEAAPLIAGLLS